MTRHAGAAHGAAVRSKVRDGWDAATLARCHRQRPLLLHRHDDRFALVLGAFPHSLRECPLILAEEAAAKGALLQRVEDGVPIGLREAQYGPSQPTS